MLFALTGDMSLFSFDTASASFLALLLLRLFKKILKLFLHPDIKSLSLTSCLSWYRYEARKANSSVKQVQNGVILVSYH